jgi:hypothetical protein
MGAQVSTKLEKIIFKDLTNNNFTLKRAKALTGGGITSLKIKRCLSIIMIYQRGTVKKVRN